MSNKFFGNLDYCCSDSLFEDRTLEAMMKKERKRERDEAREKKHDEFVMESRFQLMEDSLKKSKPGSKEYDAILSECVDIYMDLHNVNEDFKENIVKYVKNKALDDEIVSKFDKDSKSENKWPKTGRITLRDAIPRDMIGQNKKAKYPEKVTHLFGGDKVKDNQPSPSSKSKDEKKEMEEII